MIEINQELRAELRQLFERDQILLEQLSAAKESEDTFRKAYEQHVELVLGGKRPSVFYDLAVYQAWAAEHEAPELVKQYVMFMDSVIHRLKEIVAVYGWPHRGLVGDDVAFFVLFLFGHADTANEWRKTQLPALTEAYQTGEIEPRLYAHLCDRVEALDGKPQIFGTIMGPGNEPGDARIYWPLRDTEYKTNARRVELGLPTIEEDLAQFRDGATIGPFMSPVRRT
jgi:hypothetical protein